MWRSSSAAPTPPTMNCQGTHDPMRPINNYVRVIDLAAPASRHTGATNNIGRRRLDDGDARNVLPAGHAAAGGRLAAVGRLAGALHHALGVPERRGREQRDREPPQGRRQELHRPDLEPRGQGAVRQELRHQRLRERPEPRRARRDVAGRQHHGRHAHRRHLLGLEGFRRRDGAGEDRADARRLAVLRSRRDGGEGESRRCRDAGACTCAACRPWRRRRRRRRRAAGGATGADRHVRKARRRPVPAHHRTRQLRFADRGVQGPHHDARGRTDPRRVRSRTSPKRRSSFPTSRSATS